MEDRKQERCDGNTQSKERNNKAYSKIPSLLLYPIIVSIISIIISLAAVLITLAKIYFR